MPDNSTMPHLEEATSVLRRIVAIWETGTAGTGDSHAKIAAEAERVLKAIDKEYEGAV